MEEVYPKSYVTRIMICDTVQVLVGLALAASPFLMGMHDLTKTLSAIDTTVHVALGALIATPSVFRVAVGYAAAWVEVVNFVLGLIVALLPKMMHMSWDTRYAMGHYVAGGIVMLMALASGIMTATRPKPTNAM